MMSSKSSLKRNVKNYFEEITPFDLFYQLTYMSATAAAGISRARIFQLARSLPSPTAQFFKQIDEVATNLRYNYPDAVHMVGEQAKMEEVKSFLLRLSDALRSGEPLAGFLAQEANVLSDTYLNDYETKLESLKKWTDAFTAVSVSAALIVIMNMVMTMIYNVGVLTMAMMVFVSVAATFGVAWIMFRTLPESFFVPLEQGSKDQKLARQLGVILIPVGCMVSAIFTLFHIDYGWVLILLALFLLPVGIISSRFDSQTARKENEISPFLRSVGGTATSRGTTLREAIATMKKDSFPTLLPDIRMLNLRLAAFVKPEMCWRKFAQETGSMLAQQSVNIFTEAVGLGGDPERTGGLTSKFAMRTAMLRAKRRGVASTFTWLAIVMHSVMSGLMIFLLGILMQFSIRLEEAMSALGGADNAMAAMGLKSMFSFNAPQLEFLRNLTVGMIIVLAVINAFAIVATEGSHLIKTTFYLAILFIVSGFLLLIGPSLVKLVM
jgi:flagellar protein FlaJ